jgi:hypothetical protein
VSITVGCVLDRQGAGIQILGRGKRFSLLHGIYSGYEAHPASYLMGTRGPFPGGCSTWGMKLTTQIELVPKLRIHGAVHPSPIHHYGMVLN